LAIAYKNRIAFNFGSSATLLLFPSATAAVGDLLVVSIVVNAASRTISGVTDSVGNTYTLLTAATGRMSAGLAYSMCTVALTSAGSITITLGGSGSDAVRAVADTYSGIATSSPFDVSASNTGSGTTSSVTLPTTTQADEIVIGTAVIQSDRTSTPLSGYTDNYQATASGSYTIQSLYQIVSSTGVYTPGTVFSGTATTTAAVGATFKAIAAGGSSFTSPLATLTLAALTPSASANVAATSPLAALTVTPLTPAFSVAVSYTSPLAALTLAAMTPSVTVAATYTSPLAALSLTAQTPSATADVSVTSPVAALTVTALTPSFTTATSFTSPLASLTVSPQAPSFSAAVSYTSPVAALSLAALIPSFSTATTYVSPTAALTSVRRRQRIQRQQRSRPRSRPSPWQP
jgi:hypothetical protein